MQDLGDKILCKDINGDTVIIPKTCKITSIRDLERAAAFVGFDDALGVLMELKAAMDRGKVPYHMRSSEDVKCFLEGCKL